MNPGNPQRKLWKPKFSNMTPPPSHSSRLASDNQCTCTACEIAKITIFPGKISKTTPLTEFYWKLLYPDIPYPTPKLSTPKLSVQKRWKECFAVIGKGRVHNCTKKVMQENIHQIVINKSLNSKEKITGIIIKDIFDDKMISKKGGTVQLKTGGPTKLSITLGIKIKKGDLVMKF